MMEIKVI